MLDSNTGYVNSKVQRTGKLYLNSACRPCHNHRVQVVAKLKLKHPSPRLAHHASAADGCPSCFWTTRTAQTNSGDGFAGSATAQSGLMGDSVEGVRKALTYLETRSTQAAPVQ